EAGILQGVLCWKPYVGVPVETFTDHRRVLGAHALELVPEFSCTRCTERSQLAIPPMTQLPTRSLEGRAGAECLEVLSTCRCPVRNLRTFDDSAPRAAPEERE